jgi:hypothetical protein
VREHTSGDDDGQLAGDRAATVDRGLGELRPRKGRPSPSGRDCAPLAMPCTTGWQTFRPTSFISHSDLRKFDKNSAKIRATSRFVPARRCTSRVSRRVSKRETSLPGSRAMFGSEGDFLTGAGVQFASLATGGPSSGSAGGEEQPSSS